MRLVVARVGTANKQVDGPLMGLKPLGEDRIEAFEDATCFR